MPKSSLGKSEWEKRLHTIGADFMIPLSEAAARLNLTRAKAYDDLLLGKFGPPERRRGRWFVSPEAVERLAAERDAAKPPVVQVQHWWSLSMSDRPPAGTALVVLATLNHPDREGDLIVPGSLANDRAAVSRSEHAVIRLGEEPVGEAHLFERDDRLWGVVMYYEDVDNA
jgi:hypothetical protein